MRWSVALPLFAALALGAAGCRSSCDRVESELRAREQDVRTLKDEVDRLGGINHALTHELAAIHGEPGPDGLIHRPSEPYPMRSLVLGRGTGGRSDEACGGDDGLIVVVEPRDCDDQAIKAPGQMVIDVIETPREGPSGLLKRYEISPEQLRQTWQSGLFSTGYRLSLGFERWPITDRLRVVAYFRMMNGRVFEAGKDVVIRLPQEKMRRPLNPPSPTPPLPDPTPGPAPAPAPETLPAPKEMLPPPDPVPDDPPQKKPPMSQEGPVLTRVKGQKPPIVEMFRPVPMRDE
jgi:hypothetical protein